ncbi:Nuclear transition protein like [Actinidia chinensis var. chinensis]|uniref:Nuclear transition protein like n=1 Tax=Actinidia chinensis var. chinensis TaxID=1590841 RepID=A0A2R6RQZ3_ACTCC|nr:Nuclear transition protein like [Actinidia chinensis var. chinensis]
MGVSSYVAVVLLVVVVSGGLASVQSQTSPSQCKEEKRLLVNECRGVIFGQNPSASCCQRVRVTHVECVCPSVTPKLAAIIGVERTIKQIQGCGRTVPRNFKCGSVTTPP